MNKVKWSLLVYAILAAASIIGIGIAISEKSLLGAIACVLAIVLIMGMGFNTKRKMRESGQL
jgi:arginine exporter protein ArgO